MSAKGTGWFSAAGRAGRFGRSRKEPPRMNEGVYAKWACRCGAPGPSLCVCDPEYDKLVQRMISYERLRRRARRAE